MNSAAFLIAQKAPDKLYECSELKLAAEEKARTTYVYKKRSGSRSKFEPAKEIQKRGKMSTSERKEEIAFCSSRIQTMTSRITELERDINRARATKDYVSCSNLHGQQRKMIKDLNGLKNKLANVQKKEIKHQKYMAKRSDEDKSKTSSSDYGDVVQTDIRHFLQKKEGTSSCSITCLNAEEKMHGPQSNVFVTPGLDWCIS